MWAVEDILLPGEPERVVLIVVNNFGALGSALSLTWLALNTGSESLYCTISVENINGYVWLVIAATVAIDINIMMSEGSS